MSARVFRNCWRQIRCSHSNIITLVLVLLVSGVFFGSGQALATGSANKQSEVNAIVDELERLQTQMDNLSENYAQAINDYETLTAEMGTAEAELTAKEKELDAKRGELRKSALQAFMNGGRNDGLATLLTDTGGLTQSVQREYLTGIALNAGSDQADELSALVDGVTNERLDLQRQQDLAQGMARKMKQRQDAVETLTETYKERKRRAEAELGDLLAQEQARREDQALRDSQNQTREWESRPIDTGNYPAPSARAQTAINMALSQQGVPYNNKACCRSNPGQGFDCSGLTMWAWGRAGVSIPGSSRTQYASLPHVPMQVAQPGDLIFYGSPIGHVGIYLGGGRLVHSPQWGDVVNVSAVRWSRVVGVARP